MTALGILVAVLAVAFVAWLAYCEDLRSREVAAAPESEPEPVVEEYVEATVKRPKAVESFREYLRHIELTAGERPAAVELSRRAISALADDVYIGRVFDPKAMAVRQVSREKYREICLQAAERRELSIYGIQVTCDSAATGRDQCGGPSEQPDVPSAPVGNGSHPVNGFGKDAGPSDGATYSCRASGEAAGHD